MVGVSETVSSARSTTVRVPVTSVWSGPDSPRPVDAPMLADPPDPDGWLRALDSHPDDDESGDGRLGLHGRIETQLVDGEAVLVVGTDPTGHWSEVRCPWQLSPKDATGYPGWVRTSHLHPGDGTPTGSTLVGDPAVMSPPHPVGAGPEDHPALGLAREHLGVAYLWGGLTPAGLDCSGLVLHTWRRLGMIVARDAYAQAASSIPVPTHRVRAGDLYFFAHEGRRIHHVGIVVEPGRMLHASETGRFVVEEQLPEDRLRTLVSAGRLPLPLNI